MICQMEANILQMDWFSALKPILLKFEADFMKNFLILLLSLIIALLIIIFTDFAEGETAKLENQLYEVTYDDYQTKNFY